MSNHVKYQEPGWALVNLLSNVKGKCLIPEHQFRMITRNAPNLQTAEFVNFLIRTKHWLKTSHPDEVESLGLGKLDTMIYRQTKTQSTLCCSTVFRAEIHRESLDCQQV